MQIKGADGYSPEMIRDEIGRGGRLVIYVYCVSILVMTFKRGTGVHFIRAGQSPVARGLPFTFVTLLFGWWGFPWGPIYSIECLFKNLQGGIDVTDEVLANIMPRAPSSYSSDAASSVGHHHNAPERAPLPPRKPAFTLTPKVIGIGVASLVALAFGIFAIASHEASQNLTVAVVNGLPTRTAIKVNDQNLVVAPYGQQLIQIPEGEIQVGATAVTSAETIRVETDFWSRLFKPQILVINPDRVALIEISNVIYQPSSSTENLDHLASWKLLTNESHYILPEPDYAFVPPPEKHSVAQGQKFVKKIHVTAVKVAEIDQRLGLVKDNLKEAAAKTYANNLSLALPDSPEVPQAVIEQLDHKDALAVMEPRLADRPLRVEWHRAYHTLAQVGFPEIDLHARYTELVEKNPRDGTAFYLRGRLDSDVDKAREDFNSALSAPSPCPYAHVGLGYLDSASARFQDALDHYNAALTAGVSNDTVRKSRREMLAALRRHDELLKDIAERRAAEPSNVILMAEELRATASAPTATAASIEALLTRCVARAEREATTEQKKLIRPYLDAQLAYALGDEKRFATSSEALKGVRSSFEAAISRRDHVAAKLAVQEVPELPAPYYLELYLVAAQNRDTSAADTYWASAVEALGRSGSGEKLVADQLTGRTTLNPEELRKAGLSSSTKSLLFACLGLQKPDHRAKFFAWSTQHNYTAEFPSLLIDSVIRTGNEKTTML